MSIAISSSGERNAKGLIGTLSLTRSYLNSHFSQFDSNVLATSIFTRPSPPVPGKHRIVEQHINKNFHLSRFNPSFRLTSSFGIHFTSDIFRNTLLLPQAKERRRQPRSHSNFTASSRSGSKPPSQCHYVLVDANHLVDTSSTILIAEIKRNNFIQ